MAVKSKIAELVVGFVTTGAKEALSVVKSTTQYVLSAAKSLALLGGGIAGGILAAASRGTIEGERFGQALEYLARVIGDSLAPYLRMATLVVFKLAEGFRALSPELKQQIAQWMLVAAGVAAFIALLPLISAGVAAVGAAFSLLLSPVGLTVLAIGGVIYAFSQLFDFVSGGSASTADDVNAANKSWVERAIDWAQQVANAFGRSFNWIMQQAAKASDWIADKLGWAAELIGIVPEGTREMLKSMDPIKPFQLETGKIDLFFEKVKRGAKSVLPVLGGIFGAIQDELNRPNNGFKLKLKVELESVQGTYDRLLKAFAEGDGEDIAQAQLAEQKALNVKINDFIGVVKNGLKDFGIIGP